jgi:hypothetical protein
MENKLEVGVHENGREVTVEVDGIAPMVFSPQQARTLAFLLIEQAAVIDEVQQ